MIDAADLKHPKEGHSRFFLSLSKDVTVSDLMAPLLGFYMFPTPGDYMLPSPGGILI